MQHVSVSIIDSHFHYDRIIQEKRCRENEKVRREEEERKRLRFEAQSPEVSDIRYRDRPEEVSHFIGDRPVSFEEYMGQQEVSHIEATTSDEEPSADISRKREHSSLANASEECPEKKKKADEPLETRVSRPLLTPLQRSQISKFKSDERKRFEKRWEELNILSSEEQQTVRQFATVSVSEASSFRSVTQTSVGLRIQIDDSQSKVCISPVQHVSGMIIDSHFHYDRIDEMFNHVPGKLKILGAIHKVRAHGGEGEGGGSLGRCVRITYTGGGSGEGSGCCIRTLWMAPYILYGR